MTALASVPRLNHGLPTFRRLAAISRIFTSGLRQLHDGLDLEYRQP